MWEKLDEFLRKKHSLPDNWQVSSWEKIPKDSYTHHLIKGSLTTTYKKGRYKGEPKWLPEEQREFIFSQDEIDDIIKL
jgi:hypothetical protein